MAMRWKTTAARMITPMRSGAQKPPRLCWAIWNSRSRRGTDRVFPSKFTPPVAYVEATSLFHESTDPTRARFVHLSDPRKCLFHTNGVCINSGQPNPQAGRALVFGPGPGSRTSYGRLELKDPFRGSCPQTSNQAELRAVLEALRAADWAQERFCTIVIATDSEYAVKGATEWVRKLGTQGVEDELSKAG